jgi:hypothetical protein
LKHLRLKSARQLKLHRKQQVKLQLLKHQLAKHLQHQRVQLLVQHLVLDQEDRVLVTTHLLQHRAHRAQAIIHFHPAVQDHVLAAA